MGCKYTGMDNTNSVLVMVTGLVKFLKYIAGLMIMVKMEENLFCKQNQLEPMNSTISSGDKPIFYEVTPILIKTIQVHLQIAAKAERLYAAG